MVTSFKNSTYCKICPCFWLFPCEIQICYFFYKNLTFGFTLFWYEAYASFSGKPAYNDWYMSCFNVFFTSLPVIALGVFDQDVSARLCLKVKIFFSVSFSRLKIYHCVSWNLFSTVSVTVPRRSTKRIIQLGTDPRMDVEWNHKLNDHFLPHNQHNGSSSFSEGWPSSWLLGSRSHNVLFRGLDGELPNGDFDKLLHLDPTLLYLGKHRGLVFVSCCLRFPSSNVFHNRISGLRRDFSAESNLLAHSFPRGVLCSLAVFHLQGISD